MSQFLIDTSAWVAFFRGDADAVSLIDPLVVDGSAAICGPVYAEVLSGAPNRMVQKKLGVLLRSLHWLTEPVDVWEHIANTRFLLARQGYQVMLVDVMIALTATEAGAAVLTRDRDFEYIQKVLALNLTVF